MYTWLESKSKNVSLLFLFVLLSAQKLCSFVSAPTVAMILGILNQRGIVVQRISPLCTSIPNAHSTKKLNCKEINWVIIDYIIIGAYNKTHLWMVKIVVIMAPRFKFVILMLSYMVHWGIHYLQIMSIPISEYYFPIICTCHLLLILR